MENMGFKNQRKRKRRTSQRRKLPSDSSMDVAEARREIVNALHLHRSSSSMPSSDTRLENMSLDYKTSMPSSTENTITSSQLDSPLVESIQFRPEPTWSTTDPAAAAAAALLATPPPLDQILEFEWPENNLSSSYSWWLGFLRSLDSGKDGADQLSEYYYSCQENVSAGSEMNMVSLDQNEQSPTPEAYEWLTITAAEDEVEVLQLPG